MLRAFLARAAAIAVLCAPVLGCSSPDRPAEGRVSSLNQALDGGTAGGGGAADAGPADSGPADAGPSDSGPADAAPACASNADCGNGCGVCTAGVCSLAAATVTCRPAAAGGCDVAEKCTGANKDCPADAFSDSSVVCRPANGVCDPAEKCTGTSAVCPANVFATATTTCHASLGVCDPVEKCDGAGNCPADVKLGPSDPACRPAAAGGCDVAETCDGIHDDCPADAFSANTVTCHAGNGVCDPALKCPGNSAACPAVVFASATTVCRASQGMCDVVEDCDGAGNCPADGKLGPNDPSPCGPLKGPCDIAEVCSGTSNDCPAIDAKQPATHICRDIKTGSKCDVPEYCNGSSDTCPADGYAAQGVECNPVAGLCDVAEKCSGTSPDCPPDAFQPATYACRPASTDPTSCDVPEFCSGADAACPPDAVAPNTVVCRPLIPQQPCDQVEKCDGVTKVCPPNAFKPKGSSCDDGFACTETDTCDEVGKCSGTPNNNLCPPEACAFAFCSATLGCQHTLDPATKVCRPALDVTCDVAENCDGVNGACPADVVKPATTECQALSCADATLKPQILCNGNTGTCPVVASTSCGNFACGSATECRTTCLTSSDCGVAFYCLNNDCVPRIGAGQACKSDAECSTSNAHCADGVCCDTTCVGQCEACNLPGKVGTCTGVQGDPVTPRAKCAADGTKCDGFCDPSNRIACQFPTTATSCRDASCDTSTNAALAESFCTGKGSCALTKSSGCEPYACSGTACAGNCTADAQCAADAYCQSGKCTPKAALAGKCTTDKQCGSGHCADGVCCDTECTGQCEACSKVPNANAGTCSPVTGAPLGKRTLCAATDAACGGACDGANRQTCAYPAQGKVCRGGSCADGQATVTGYCDGHGACPAVQTVSCEKGCEGTVCAGDECLLDSDCKGADKYCAAGACTPKATPGSACSSASACSSGFCTDGVCCDSACLGQCEACDASGSMGTCSAVPKGDSPHGGRTSCITDGSACGGVCDGSTRTSCKYPLDVTCRAGSCVAGVGPDDPATSILEASCIGNGRCPAEEQQLCGQDGCDSSNTICNGACAVDESACKSGEYCAAGECVPKLVAAAACANDAQCASKFCVDGVCCNKSCSDQCAACDVPGSVGTCTPVTGAAHGGRAACGGVGSCGAACDGNIVASCSFADTSVSCGDAFCSVGIKGDAPMCDGEGTCAPANVAACSSFSCDGAECSSACTTDSDCVKQFECRKGVCLPPILIDAVDKGTCGCSAPGSRPRAPAALFLLLGLCAAAAFRRRRAA